MQTETAIDVIVRQGRPEDAAACGKIAFEAFKSISDEHNFPWDFPSAAIATELTELLLSHPGFYAAVAEVGGAVVGSAFLDRRNPIFGIGPVSVAPATQNRSIGRRLMLDLLQHSEARGAPGIRLVQSAYHNRSLGLYTKLGFDAREALSKLDGPPPQVALAGYVVRPATDADLVTCNALCRAVHGHDRGGELRNGVRQGTARVVEHLGEITAYASNIAFFGHAVARTNQGLQALIGAAPGFPGGGFLLPTRNAELFRWCLQHGLRLVHQMTLMTIGLYNEPAGPYLPSVLY